jgi:hypothetical protein
MKNFEVIMGFVVLFLFSCNQNYVKSSYPIPSKQLFKKQLYYKEKYGYINQLSDTVIENDNIRRIYKNGILQQIGKVSNDKPMGYWFFFKGSLELEYIYKYQADKIDTFYHPFSIVHQRW